MGEGGEGIPLQEEIGLTSKKLFEPKLVNPEKTKLQELERIFGTAFSSAYEKAKVFNLEPGQAEEIVQEARGNRSVKQLIAEVDNKLDGLTPTVRIVEVARLIGYKTEYKRYLALEHGIRTYDGRVNDQVRCLELIDLDRKPQTGFYRKDILWVNNKGEIYSLRQENDLEENYPLVLHPAREREECTGGSSINTNLLDDEDGIAAVFHELGHRKYVPMEHFLPFANFVKARGQIEKLRRSLKSQALSFPTEKERLKHMNYLRLFIEGEFQGWYQGGKLIKKAMEKGFPLITGNFTQVYQELANSHLATYQETYKEICDFFGESFTQQQPFIFDKKPPLVA